MIAIACNERVLFINATFSFKDWDLQLLLNQLKRSHAHDF